MKVTVSFQDIRFFEKENQVEAVFYKAFHFMIQRPDIERIGSYIIDDGKIILDTKSENKAWNKINSMIDKGFRQMTRMSNEKRTVYVHKNSGIPLFGSGSFGIVDRGTTLIEIKPLTGCNINCIYCSVDEKKRQTEFVVEKDYMIEELQRLLEYKDEAGIEIHIGTQGEPLLYSPLADLIRDMAALPQVKTISMDTNATMLTRKKVDELLDAGLTRFNVSLNATDKKIAEKIADCRFDVDHVIDMCKYIQSKGKSHILIAPILLDGINNDQMDGIIQIAGDSMIGIQNFLNYKFGKNPIKQIDMEKFMDYLKDLEKETGKKLILDESDFDIRKSKELPKPFKKGDIIKADIISPGRLPKERIAVAEGRCIVIGNAADAKGSIRVKLTRTKHNIFYGMKL